MFYAAKYSPFFIFFLASKLLINRTKTTAASNIVKKHKQDDNSKNALAEYRLIYPEFLPDPRIDFRNSVREKLERMDMISRRSQIDIPEFYVGKYSIHIHKMIIHKIYIIS